MVDVKSDENLSVFHDEPPSYKVFLLFPLSSKSGTKKEPAGLEHVYEVTPVQKHRPTDSKNESSKNVLRESPPMTGATAASYTGVPSPFAFNIALKEQKARAAIPFFANFFEI